MANKIRLSFTTDEIELIRTCLYARARTFENYMRECDLGSDAWYEHDQHRYQALALGEVVVR